MSVKDIEALRSKVRREISGLNRQVERLYYKLSQEEEAERQIGELIEKGFIQKLETLHEDIKSELSRIGFHGVDVSFLGQDVDGLKEKIITLIKQLWKGELQKKERWPNDLLFALKDYHMGLEIQFKNAREQLSRRETGA